MLALEASATKLKAAMDVPRWKVESIEARCAIGMPAGEASWSTRSQLGALPTERERDLLDVAGWSWQTQHSSGDGKPPPLFVDLSQSIPRMPWGASIGGFHQHSKIYSFSLDRLLDYKAQGPTPPHPTQHRHRQAGETGGPVPIVCGPHAALMRFCPLCGLARTSTA
jgi:hypothetical protein